MKKSLLTVIFLMFANIARGETPALDTPAAERIRAGLPAGLAMTELHLPGNVGPGANVVWVRPPKAGTITVLLEDGPRRVWARARLVPIRPVLVARKALKAGARLAAADLTIEQRPDDGTPLRLSPEGLQGAEILRDVPAGGVLDEATLVLPPPIARGTEVTILARAGNIRVSAAGTLEKPARPGEESTARLGNRLVAGVLVDATTFEVTR